DDLQRREQIDLCLRGHAQLRIDNRTRSARRWVRVAAHAAVGIESWSESLFGARDAAGDRLNLREFLRAVVKELFLFHREASNRAARSGAASPRSRIERTVLRHHHRSEQTA